MLCLLAPTTLVVQSSKEFCLERHDSSYTLSQTSRYRFDKYQLKQRRLLLEVLSAVIHIQADLESSKCSDKN